MDQTSRDKNASFVIVLRLKTFSKAKWNFTFYKYLHMHIETDCFANVADCNTTTPRPAPPNGCKRWNAATGHITWIQLEDQGYKPEVNTTTFKYTAECIKVCVLP